MKLTAIKLTGISIVGDPKGGEALHISAAIGEGDKEKFATLSTSTNGVLTLQHLQDLIDKLSKEKK